MKHNAAAVVLLAFLGTCFGSAEPVELRELKTKLCASIMQRLSAQATRAMTWAAPQIFQDSGQLHATELALFLERHTDHAQLGVGLRVAPDAPELEGLDSLTRKKLVRLVSSGGILERGEQDSFRVSKEGTPCIRFSEVSVLPHEADHFEVWERWVDALKPALGRADAGMFAYAAMSTPVGNLYVEASALKAQLRVDKQKTPSLRLAEELLIAQPYAYLSAIGKGFRLRSFLDLEAPLQAVLENDQRQIGERLLKNYDGLNRFTVTHLKQALADYSPGRISALHAAWKRKMTPERIAELNIEDVPFPLNVALMANSIGRGASVLFEVVDIMDLEHQSAVHALLVELLYR